MLNRMNCDEVLSNYRAKRNSLWKTTSYSNETCLESEARHHAKNCAQFDDFLKRAIDKNKLDNEIFENIKECTGLPKLEFLKRLLLEKPYEVPRRQKIDPAFNLQEFMEALPEKENLQINELISHLTNLRKLLIHHEYRKFILESGCYFHRLIEIGMQHEHLKVIEESLYTASFIMHQAPSLFEYSQMELLTELMTMINSCYEIPHQYYIKCNTSKETRLASFPNPDASYQRFKRAQPQKGPSFLISAIAMYTLAILLDTYRSKNLLRVFIYMLLPSNGFSQQLFLQLLVIALSSYGQDVLDSEVELCTDVCNKLRSTLENKDDNFLDENETLIRACIKKMMRFAKVPHDIHAQDRTFRFLTSIHTQSMLSSKSSRNLSGAKLLKTDLLRSVSRTSSGKSLSFQDRSSQMTTSTISYVRMFAKSVGRESLLPLPT